MNAAALSHRPLLPAALAVISGTWLSLHSAMPGTPFLIAVWTVFLVSALLCKKFRWLFVIPVLLAAFLNAEHRSVTKDPSSLLHQMDGEHAFVRMQVELTSLPERKVYAEGRLGPLQANGRALALFKDDAWSPLRGQIRLRDRSGDLFPFRVGDQLDVEGGLRIGPSVILPHPLQGVISLREGDIKVVQRAQSDHLAAWCARQRDRCARVLELGLHEHPAAAQIVQAVLLGYREGIPSQWVRHFAATGTLHVFAISGLHVGLVALMLIGLLRLCGLGPHQWVWLLLPLLMFYTLLTGAQSSAVRACVMAVTYWSALALKRKPDGPSALALAAILMLTASPDQLFSVGFLFSFLVVGGLLLLCGPMYQALSREPDTQFLPLKMNLWQRMQIQLENKVLMMLTVSVAAWLVSAPLTAYFFNRFTPIALIGNLLVAPAAFLMISLGLAALAAGSLHPSLAVPFNRMNAEVIELLLGIIQRLSELPLSNAYVKSPSLLWMALAYGVIAMPLILHRRKRIRISSICLGLLMLSALPRVMSAPRLQVLSTGKGMSLLLNVRGSGDMLIDTGGRSDSWSVIRALRAEGIDQLDALMLTHPDANHYGGVSDIADALPIATLLRGPMTGSKTYREKIENFHGLPGPSRARHRARPGETASEIVSMAWKKRLRGDVLMEVLYPPADINVKRADEGALVFRLSRGTSSILVLGDANQAAQRAMLDMGIHPHADTLIVAGSDQDLDPVFIAWCQPRHIVFTGPRPSSSAWAHLMGQVEFIQEPTVRSSFRSSTTLDIGF